MKDRQDVHHEVARSYRQPRFHLHGIGNQVFVRKHDRLGRAFGPGGEHDQGRGFGVLRPERAAPKQRRDQPVEARYAVAQVLDPDKPRPSGLRGLDDVVQSGFVDEGARGDDHSDWRRANRRSDIRRTCRVIDHRRHPAGRHHAHEHHCETVGIRHHDADRLAGRRHTRESTREDSSSHQQLAVGQRSADDVLHDLPVGAESVRGSAHRLEEARARKYRRAARFGNAIEDRIGDRRRRIA